MPRAASTLFAASFPPPLSLLTPFLFAMSSPENNAPAASAPLILSIRNVSKSFPGVHALRDVSFDVERGSIHAMMGENGAGKSTLMQIIAGAQPSTSGEITFEGQPIHFSSPSEAQARGIVIVYQELNLAPNLSVAENIFLGCEPKMVGLFVDRKKLVRDTLGALEELGVDINPDTLVSSLSVAQQQLIEIAKSLVRRPRLLILDEPTSSLSEAESKILFRVIRRLQSQGVTMMYISHRLPEVFAMCDTVTILRDGMHVRTLKTKSTTDEEIVRLMVGRDLLAFQRNEPPAASKEVVKVDSLTRKGRYNGVSFSIRSGEIVGMAGLIGAGRSDVALGLFGAINPDTGAVTLNGTNVRFNSPKEAVAAGVALVPEDRKALGLEIGASVGDNISVAALRTLARLTFINRSKERSLINRFISRLQVRTSSSEKKVGLLSGGNQQKVLIAKWLATQPKFLIVDEPTRGVDVGTKAEIYTLLDELAKAGLAILVISSDLPEVIALSDRILVMRGGKITGEIQRKDASEERIMALAALEKPGEEELKPAPALA